ncbi:hypothetical protein FACS189430_03510 [Bacteroidia bacterium]|nr:hypothetical protein FACS189430_03510 [Bacteroidia bacterium]
MHLNVLKRKFLFEILILSLIGCNSNNTDKTDSLKVIDIEQIYELSPMKAGDIVKDFSYIPLETTDHSIMGEILEIIPSETGFLILDYSNHLTLFGHDGHFIHRIARKGNGPGEYLQLSDIDISEDEKIIYILDGGKSQILLYSFDNKFIRSIKIERLITKFIKTPFGFICYKDPFMQVNGYGTPVPTLITLDNDGKESGTLQYRTVNLQHPTPFIHFPLLRKFKNQYFYYPPFQDTIYSVYQDKIVPEFVLFKGTYSISVEEVADLEMQRKAYERGLTVRHFAINDHWLFFMCRRNNNVELFLYNLATKQLSNLSGKNHLPTILNDIDNTFGIYPKIFYDNYLLEIKPAYEILEEQLIPEALKKIHPEDNPVIRISSFLLVNE